jgi:hypothetical protein
VDYAKRAAELVQVDKMDGRLAGQWRPVIGEEWMVDPDGEHAAEVTEQIRTWLAAELRAAHDAGVAEERARWTPIAMAAREALAKYAHDTGYGFFIGGDPRRFTPDEESTTPEEMAAWKAACAEAEANEKARDLESPCGLETVEHEGRNVPAFVDRAPFGLGTYECGDEEAEAACEAITALLGDGLIEGAMAPKEGAR